MPPIASVDVPALVDALVESLAGPWGAPRRRAVLTAAAPRLELEVARPA